MQGYSGWKPYSPLLLLEMPNLRFSVSDASSLRSENTTIKFKVLFSYRQRYCLSSWVRRVENTDKGLFSLNVLLGYCLWNIIILGSSQLRASLASAKIPHFPHVLLEEPENWIRDFWFHSKNQKHKIIWVLQLTFKHWHFLLVMVLLLADGWHQT